MEDKQMMEKQGTEKKPSLREKLHLGGRLRVSEKLHVGKRLKKTLIIVACVAAGCGAVWGGLTIARNAQRGDVNVYAVGDFAMTDYWGDSSNTSGMVTTDKLQKIYISQSQTVTKVWVKEGDEVRKGEPLVSYDSTLTEATVEKAKVAYDRAVANLEAAKGQLEHLQAAANRAGKIDEQLEKLREDNARETEEISAAEQDKATQDERNRIVRKHLEDLRSRVSIACDGHSTVAARMGALRHRASSAGCLAAAQRALSSARDNERLRAELLAAELEVCGFASATEAEEALLPELDRNDLRDHIEGHRRDSDQVEGSLQAPRLATLGDAATAPTDDLENAKAAAEEEVRTFTLTQGALTQTIKASRDALKDLDKTMAEFAGIERAAGPVVRMAELANAQQGNQLRMTLPTFVLLQRFEEVVDLANVRLSAMTDGRYQMRRTDAKEGRSQKLGLGLEVIDHASGDATREPQTLSGGETFKASLAMALGLADAVTAEAGGVELNTLFVDEGFGSLDPESLDAVMDQMTKLRQTGRTVGVISHVVEMKQRIAERVTVRPNGDGTSRLSCTVSEQVALRIGHNHSPSRLM